MEKFEEIKKQEINIAEKEKGIFSKFGERIVDFGKKFIESPKKVSQVVALMMILRASTAFAETNAEKPEFKEIIEPTAKIKKTDVSPGFDWKKFIKQVEISYKIEAPTEKEIEIEPIGIPSAYEAGSPLGKAVDFFFSSVYSSNSVGEYFDKISKGSEGFSDTQKLHYLQWLGKSLSGTYNYDMTARDKYIKISEEEMFQALKDYLNGKEVRSGICSNIHTFMAKTAEKMGIEAWVQSGRGKEGTNHVFMGALAGDEDGKQIVFLDYETLIPTKTLNYQNALGIAERYHEHITLFNSVVERPNETPIFVKSLAMEKMEEAAGIVEAEQIIGELTEEGKFKTKEGLTIDLSKETQKIELSKNVFGISFYNYQNAGNPYNSLESLQSARGKLRLEEGTLCLEASATILQLDIKNLDNQTLSQNEIVGQTMADYTKGIKLTKGDYEKLKLNFAATLSAAFAYAIETNQFVGKKVESGFGARLVYVNPSQTGKFWVGAEDVFRLNMNDLKNQDLIVQNTAQNFRLGGEIKVKEGIITNLETILGKTPWGKKTGIKAGIEAGKLKVAAGVEEIASKEERFVPSALKIGGEIGYKMPKGEINIYGAIEKEKYKGAPEEKQWEVGVRYRIVLWK